MSTSNLENLFQKGVLIDLDIGYWSARKKNDERDLGISPEDVPEYVVGLGTKRLIPKEFTQAWMYNAGRARRLVAKYAQTFPVGKSSFVSMAALPLVEDGLRAEQKEFNHAKNEFENRFHEIKENFLAGLRRRDRERIEGQIPAKSIVMRKFYFSWQPYAIELPKKLRIAVLNRDKQAAEANAQTQYALALEKRAEEFLESSVLALRAKTVELFETIAAKLKSGEVITNRSLETLRGHVEKFKLLNVVGDREIERRLTDIETRLLDGTDSESFDADRMRAALAKATNGIIEAASNTTDVSSVTGQFRRRIAL